MDKQEFDGYMRELEQRLPHRDPTFVEKVHLEITKHSIWGALVSFWGAIFSYATSNSGLTNIFTYATVGLTSTVFIAGARYTHINKLNDEAIKEAVIKELSQYLDEEASEPDNNTPEPL